MIARLLLLCGLTSVAAAQTGVQVNVDPTTHQNIKGDAANEPTIAISPLDPHRIVIGWRQFDSVKSDFRRAGVAYSDDGGRTWNANVLETPPGWPSDATQQTDPVLAVNADGVFNFWSEPFASDRPIGEYLYVSESNGEEWEEAKTISDQEPGGDKPWMAIDRTGGIGRGNIYGAWTWFDSSDYTVFVRSTDGGATFSEPSRIADLSGRQFMAHVIVGNDGEVIIAWRYLSGRYIYVTKSTNAADPDQTPTFDAYGAGGENGIDVKIAEGHDPGFMDINPVGYHQIWLGVDRTSGNRRGWLYCVWASRDPNNDPCNVVLARSADGGATWSAPIRINDDVNGASRYQWMVAMDVAPNGRIDVVWYDTRDNQSRRLSSVYYAYSLDGGDSWSANRRLSDAFDSRVGYPQQDKIGDYNQIISANDSVNIAYAATHNGEQDIYFLRAAPQGIRGDLDCDAYVNFNDIDPFVLALIGESEYADQYPLCDRKQGDINADGAVDFNDIDPFVECLINSGC